MSSQNLPSKMRAAQIHEQGDIDVIQVREVDVPTPKDGQVLIKVEYAGVNFIDTYFRGGVYKPALPYILGNESAGTVVALGAGVSAESHGYSVGDRVAAYTAGGSFAEYALAAADKVIKLPEGFSTKDAATVVTQGLTALTFVKEAHEVKPGQFILVQAAAGGLGLLLVQLAKRFGATVIGTTSTAEKAEIAKKAGADHVVLYGEGRDVVGEVYKITGGEGIDRGVHGVFDGVGKDTFDVDFDLLRRKGTLVTLGNASGAVPPFAPLKLGPKNLKVCRPVLNQYVHTREEFQTYAKELFELVQQGALQLAVHGEYPLTTEGIRQTQIDITSRKTSGKLLVKVA
ncbi:NADPH:quinone reductase [Rhodotorula kratochvilovae]